MKPAHPKQQHTNPEHGPKHSPAGIPTKEHPPVIKEIPLHSAHFAKPHPSVVEKRPLKSPAAEKPHAGKRPSLPTKGRPSKPTKGRPSQPTKGRA